MKALLQYDIFMYATNFHFSLPFLFILIYCIFFQVLVPSLAPSGFVFSLTLLFATSLTDGFFTHKIWSEDMDAVLILKSGNPVKYYVSKEVFLSLLAFSYALLIVLYPGVAALFGDTILTKPVTGKLVAICSLHFLTALLGYELGSLFHPNMIRRRRLARILFFVIIAGICLRQLLTGVPVIRHCLWIFPQVVKLIQIVHTGENYLSAQVGKIALQFALYISIVLVVKGFILSSRKWTVYE